MGNPADHNRRRWGLVFLGTALGQLILGQTVLKEHLGNGWWFLLYWLCCFALTGLAMLTALLDAWIVRIRAREQQHDLLSRAAGRDEDSATDE